jgi:hypothetical protein
MYLKHKGNGDMVEVVAVEALFDPYNPMIIGRYHAGEELQDSTQFSKSELIFPSGESLPRCWLDAHYRATLA